MDEAVAWTEPELEVEERALLEDGVRADSGEVGSSLWEEGEAKTEKTGYEMKSDEDGWPANVRGDILGIANSLHFPIVVSVMTGQEHTMLITGICTLP